MASRALPSTLVSVVENTIFSSARHVTAKSAIVGSLNSSVSHTSIVSYRRRPSSCASVSATRWLWKRCSSSLGAPQSNVPSGP